MKKMLQRFHETNEYIGKCRALAGLRRMDPQWLDKHGFSIAALNRGVEAWPWRKDEQPQAEAGRDSAITTLRSKSAAPTPDHAGNPDHLDAA